MSIAYTHLHFNFSFVKIITKIKIKIPELNERCALSQMNDFSITVSLSADSQGSCQCVYFHKLSEFTDYRIYQNY